MVGRVSRVGVKVWGSSFWGQGRGQISGQGWRGQGQGVKIVGSRSGVTVGVKVRGDQGQGEWVKVWGVGVRWSVGFSGGRLEINEECSFQELMIEIHSNPFHSNPFHSIPFQSNPFHSIPFQSNPFHSNPIHSIPCFTQYRFYDRQFTKFGESYSDPASKSHDIN